MSFYEYIIDGINFPEGKNQALEELTDNIDVMEFNLTLATTIKRKQSTNEIHGRDKMDFDGQSTFWEAVADYLENEHSSLFQAYLDELEESREENK